MRAAIVPLALSLLAATPALARDADETLEQKRARIEQLKEERDAARVKANIYVLPQHKLEAERLQKEIDELQAEIDAEQGRTGE